MLPERLHWLDEVSRRDHYYLTPADHCLYFGEFRSRAGGSGLNGLIFDFKRAPSEIARSAQPQRLRDLKERAIRLIAHHLRSQFGRAVVEGAITFVPIPGSKAPDHPDHCDRLLRTLRLAFAGLEADIRPLLTSSSSALADHRRGARRTGYYRLLSGTRLDPTQLETPPRTIVALFDDVLTSGKHVRVASARIRERLPRQTIVSVMVARRVCGSVS